MRIPIGLIFLTCVATNTSHCQELQQHSPWLGVVDESKVYSVQESLYDRKKMSKLQICPLNSVHGQRLVQDVRLSPTFPNVPLRWRIKHQILWYTIDEVSRGLNTTRIPFSDFDLFDYSNPKREEMLQNRFENGFDSLGEHSWRHLPAADISSTLPHEEVASIYADFIPVGPKAAIILILRNSQCTVWRGVFRFESKADGKRVFFPGWNGEWPDKPEEVIKTNFNEPFTIFSHSKSYFFVTMSSKIHIATSVQKGNRIAQPFWDKSDQPIGRIITDTATNRSFAFTHPIKHKDGTQARPVYFELTEKLEPKEYDPAWVKENKFESPMKEIRQAVDVLLQAGEIKMPKETPKK